MKAVGGILLTICAFGCTDNVDTDQSMEEARHGQRIVNDKKFPNPFGYAATFSTAGSVDLTGPFFQDLGTNGRTCGSCHQPGDGWTVIPGHIQQRFDETGGTDPIFRTNDGSNSPNADTSTVAARRAAYSMLLTKGLIRIGIGVPAGAEFTLDSVDDPYHYASSAELSLFRRPLQSANLNILSTVMWDGRETFVDPNSPPAADSNCFKPPFPAKCFKSLNFDLSDQSNGATLGHAQGAHALTDAQRAAIVEFETGLSFAQIKDSHAGKLNKHGAQGGPDAIPGFAQYFGLNDNFGDYRTGAPFTNVIFTLYDAWNNIHDGDDDGDDDDRDCGHDKDAARRAIARGQEVFNNKTIVISGVGGLNNVLGLPASFPGTCGTCHDALEFGNHTVPAPLNIGLADASRRTPDMPLYTLKCSAAGAAAGHCTAGQTQQTTDPGRALITGLWADVGRFKGPTLRGIAARAPYFHNGSAKDFGEVVDFYDQRFGIGFTAQEKSDLIAFLGSL
jgi:cytochrome c peroxidase